MNGQQISDKFENMIGDSLDQDFTLELINDAKNEIEEEVNPEGLKATNTSGSTFAGQTYTTGITLPADFYLPEPTIYVGDTSYTQIPLERALEYRDSGGFYYIDHANGTYHLCGTQSSIETITFPYRYATADLTVSTSPTWPSRFHVLIPLKMSMMYFAIDQGEKGRSWDDRWEVMYQRKLHRFKDYDTTLKLAGMNGSVAPIQQSGESELGINLN